MKNISLASAIIVMMTGINCLASSACIISVNRIVGERAAVVCDGKQAYTFNSDDNYLGSITLEIKKLTDRGYLLKAVVSTPSPQYVFIKD